MENERDIAIKIEGLKKRYRLGTIGGGTLVGDLQSWWARVRGKEDPNSKIGAKVYGKNETFMALDGIDLTVKKGERLGIIGHNGAGKSTLLKLLSRVTGPTEGTIKLDGRISSMLEVGTGFNGELTGRENIYLNGAILGMSKSEVDSKIEDIIEFSECRQFIDTPVKRYSSGMYVKLAFSVAAHLDSEILIMDEVLAVGDMAFQKKCLEKMSQVSKDEGRTILYVSHNMNTIRQLCERCIVMDHGKIVFNGDVEESISIYSKEWSILSDVVDTSNQKRPKYLGETLKCKVECIKALDSINSNVEECLPLEIKIKAFEAVENLKIRLEISRSRQGVAIALSKKEYKIKDNSDIAIKLRVDASQLAPGAYNTTVVLYENNNGRSIDFDCVKGISFVKKTNKCQIKWNSAAWGSICLNDMTEMVG